MFIIKNDIINFLIIQLFEYLNYFIVELMVTAYFFKIKRY